MVSVSTIFVFGVSSVSLAAGTSNETPRATPPPTFTLPAGGSNSGGASQAGGSAGATQLLGAGINVGFGGYMATQCKSNPMACMIAAQSLAQALSMFGNSSGSKKAGDAMAGVGTGGAPTYGTPSGSDLSGLYSNNGGAGTDGGGGVGGNGNGGGPTPTNVGSQLAALRADLAKMGTTLSPDGKTISLPDGRQVATGTGSSAGDLSAAGFSQSEIDAGLAAAKAAQSKFADKIQAMKVAGSGEGGGGGGGGGGSAGGSGSSGGPDYAAMMRKMNGGDARKKGSVAGMSKKLGADNIGVAGDDIFEMITRRYKARDSSNAFFK